MVTSSTARKEVRKAKEKEEKKKKKRKGRDERGERREDYLWLLVLGCLSGLHRQLLEKIRIK